LNEAWRDFDDLCEKISLQVIFGARARGGILPAQAWGKRC
jgi:hypothetical protein